MNSAEKSVHYIFYGIKCLIAGAITYQLNIFIFDHVQFWFETDPDYLECHEFMKPLKEIIFDKKWTTKLFCYGLAFLNLPSLLLPYDI